MDARFGGPGAAYSQLGAQLVVGSLFGSLATLTSDAHWPTFRDICPWFGGALVSVSHALRDCSGTRQGRKALLATRRPSTSSQELLQFLFDLNADVGTLQACIYYVNEVLVNIPRTEAEDL